MRKIYVAIACWSPFIGKVKLKSECQKLVCVRHCADWKSEKDNIDGKGSHRFFLIVLNRLVNYAVFV